MVVNLIQRNFAVMTCNELCFSEMPSLLDNWRGAASVGILSKREHIVSISEVNQRTLRFLTLANRDHSSVSLSEPPRRPSAALCPTVAA